MSAVADAPATQSDIVALLEDREMPLLELAALVDAKAIGKAWAAGHLEFGRRTYCTVGGVGTSQDSAEEGSILIIEGGMEWTGPKKGMQHKPYAGLAADELPYCEKYERADVPMVSKHDQKSDRTTYHRPQVKRQEAEKLLALQVRLTDKGMATLEV